METRSQRQQGLHRPPYPQVSTTSNNYAASTSQQLSTASMFQSSSSSLASVQSPGAATVMSPSQQAQSVSLPSPLAAQQSANYFGSLAANANAQTARRDVSATYVGQRGGNDGGTPETAPFLDNFNLVAEAAKRAQMACLMRDLGDVEL